jgi:hypothetical protein
MEIFRKKIYIVYMINFFMTISLAIALFISLYYITPANYEVIPNQKYSEKKYDKYIKIKSGSIYKLDHTSIQNLNIAFDKNIELIFSNILKSQNIIYKKNTIIKSVNSDITIVNTCNKDIKLGIKFIP